MHRSQMDLMLERTGELLSNPKRWARRVGARNAKGRKCDPLSAEAVRWCLTCALFKAAYELTEDRDRAGKMAMQCAGSRLGFAGIVDDEGELTCQAAELFNDLATHAEVLGAVNAALEKRRRGRCRRRVRPLPENRL
jgi:hypothetical protein